jgi:hypothetical protein
MNRRLQMSPLLKTGMTSIDAKQFVDVPGLVPIQLTRLLNMLHVCSPVEPLTRGCSILFGLLKKQIGLLFRTLASNKCNVCRRVR